MLEHYRNRPNAPLTQLGRVAAFSGQDTETQKTLRGSHVRMWPERMLDPDMSTPELCAAMRMERAIAFGEARRTELPKPKPTLTKAPGPHNDTKRHILTPAQIAEKEARADAAERTDAVRKNEKRKAERRAAGIAVRDRGPYRKAAN